MQQVRLCTFVIACPSKLALMRVQGVAVALGPSKQPLPAYRSSVYQEATGGRTRYGDIGDNLPLIAQMSPVSTLSFF